MATLPIFNTDVKPLALLQTAWTSILNVWLRNPHSQSITLQGVSLKVGSNAVNHLLGRKLTGWAIIRQRGPAAIYDAQDLNVNPELTLSLVSSAAVSVDIEVW